MTNFVARFLKDESGATAIEYGLIASLIALGVVGGLTSLGTSLSGKFSNMGTSL